MSRPLLGLILLNEEYFEQLRDQIIQAQVIKDLGLLKEFLYHSNLSKSHSGQRKTIDDRGLLQKSDGGCREERSDEEQRQVRGKSCNLRMEVSYSKEKFGFRGVLLFILIVQMFMCENSILLSFTKSFLL